MPRGFGYGRGMGWGRGWGRGFGRGFGRGWGPPPWAYVPPAAYGPYTDPYYKPTKEDLQEEIEILKEEKKVIDEEIAEIEGMLKEKGGK